MENTEQYLILRRRLDLLLKTGRLLVESSADTNRVRRNMVRTAEFLGFDVGDLHLFIDHNIIMANYSDELHSFSKFQKCTRHGIDFTVISAISKLTFRAVRKDYTELEFESELEKIATRPRFYSRMVTSVGAALACGGFCLQFGCDWVAFLYASLAAFVGFNCKSWLARAGINQYMSVAIAAFFSTLAAWLTTYLPAWTSTPLHPLLACALFIVPGVPLINSVDDIMDGNFRFGLERAVNTIFIMLGMAFGIVFALKFCAWTFDFEPDIMGISMEPHHSYLTYAVAAAVSAVGFSMIFNVPKRLLWVVAAGGAIAVCTRNLVSLAPDGFCPFSLGQGGIIGTLAGATLVSLVAVKAMHICHTPHQVITIASVIPMVPGVMMYRFLYSLIEVPAGQKDLTTIFTNAGVNGINSALIILGIAVGVAVPNIIARRWINRKKLIEFDEGIRRKRESGDFIDIDKL